MNRRLHPIVKEFCLEDWKHEHLHATTGALCDINEVLLALGEQTSPDYRPGCVTGPDPDTSAAWLLDAVNRGEVTLEDLEKSYAVIERFDKWLRTRGFTL